MTKGAAAESFDVVVIGAGAAGLLCAALAGQRGLRVLLVDHAPKLAEKIRISGGGRCNFTNRTVGSENFLSENPDFCRSALARYTPNDFLALLARHGIGWHEKHKGQLFCDDGSGRIIDMLVAECAAGDVTHWQPCPVMAVRHDGGRYVLGTRQGPVRADALVVATGGPSIPALGATDFGYRLARQFGHRVVEPRPALVPLVFDPVGWGNLTNLAGVALEVIVETGSGRRRARFQEDLLFTHRGLSGPAVLQISSYWQSGTAIRIDLTDGHDLAAALQAAKQAGSRRHLATELTAHLPQRLASTWLNIGGPDAGLPLNQCRDRDLQALARRLREWVVTPSGTEGWRKAEVTAGGVDTRDLHSPTLQSRHLPALYFIGEVVDVTGWLGGYNFQWAWASAAACAAALAAAHGSADDSR